MDYLIAFLVGGAMCAVAQVLIDVLKMRPAQVMVLFVSIGAILSGLGVSSLSSLGERWCRCRASATHRARLATEAERNGFLGLFTGVYEFTGGGIAVAVFLAAAIALVANPRLDAGQGEAGRRLRPARFPAGWAGAIPPLQAVCYNRAQRVKQCFNGSAYSHRSAGRLALVAQRARAAHAFVADRLR